MRFLITAGPTREPIDPVRFISNRSSGKMGYAIAEAAMRRGTKWCSLAVPSAIAPPAGARVIGVTTSEEMFNAVHANLDASTSRALRGGRRLQARKIFARKNQKNITDWKNIPLTPTRDILASLGKIKKNFPPRGFRRRDRIARGKREKKNCAKSNAT